MTPEPPFPLVAPSGPELVPPEQMEAELREVKVRLPVEQILRLHYTRMKKRENFSQIVSSALSRYFDDLSKP
jgi:hypothetical protein